LLTAMMPTKATPLKSFSDLLPAGFEMPQWMSPLIKALYFMQYFGGEMALPTDVLLEIYNETRPATSGLD